MALITEIDVVADVEGSLKETFVRSESITIQTSIYKGYNFVLCVDEPAYPI